MPKHDKAALFDSLGIRLAGFIILKKRAGKCISLLFLIACLRLCYIRGAAYACIYRTVFLKVKRRHPSPFFFPDFPHQLTSPMSSVFLMQLFACVCTKKDLRALLCITEIEERVRAKVREREEEVKEPFLSCLSIKNSTLSNTYHGFTFSFTEEAVGCMVKCPFNILLMPQTKCVECMQSGRTACINPAIRIRARAYNITANTS